MDSYLSIQEIAELYGVSTKTVRRWGSTGQIELVRLPGGRLLRADVASLQGITEPVNYKGHQARTTQPRRGATGRFLFMTIHGGF